MGDHSIDALVSSRICHDLISPVGAIGNGVELLESYSANMPEIGLIADSVDNATAKLRFFRICFGQSSEGAKTSASEAEAIGTAMVQTARLQLEWQLQATHYPRERVKLLFLILLCVETALPVGGTITITEYGDVIEVKAESPRVVVQEAWRIFTDESDVPITSAQVQFPLAKTLSRNIQVESTDTWLKVTL